MVRSRSKMFGSLLLLIATLSVATAGVDQHLGSFLQCEVCKNVVSQIQKRLMVSASGTTPLDPAGLFSDLSKVEAQFPALHSVHTLATDSPPTVCSGIGLCDDSAASETNNPGSGALPFQSFFSLDIDEVDPDPFKDKDQKEATKTHAKASSIPPSAKLRGIARTGMPTSWLSQSNVVSSSDPEISSSFAQAMRSLAPAVAPSPQLPLSLLQQQALSNPTAGGLATALPGGGRLNDARDGVTPLSASQQIVREFQLPKLFGPLSLYLQCDVVAGPSG